MAGRPDPVAEAMALLLGPGAAEVVAPAVPPGATIRSIRPAQVLLRPGRRVSVTYRAQLEWSDGTRAEETIVATVDRDGLPPGAATAVVDGQTAAVWRATQDPLLPGLRPALDPDFAVRVLTDAGVRTSKARATLRAYRPGRRAVVEVRPVEAERPRLVFSRGSGGLRAAEAAPGPALYLKVLDPARAGAVADVHRRLSAVVPAPRCSHAGAPGVLVLEALSGVTLGACLRRGRPRPPRVAELLELLGRLEAAGLEGAGARGGDVRLDRHVRLLGALLPEEADRLERLVEALAGAREQPTCAVHGDFHEGNLLVSERGVTGLLDVDGAGQGERVDDLGLMAGRLWSLGTAGASPALGYAEELLRQGDAVVDPGELRRRVGVALVGRATSPFRNQVDGWRRETRRRLQLAERWAAGVAHMLG